MEWFRSTATPTSRHNFHSETRRYQHRARAGGGHLLAGKLAGIPGWAGCPDRGTRIHLSGEQTARRPDAQQSSVNQATQSNHGSIGSVTERSTNNMCLWERPQWQHRAGERAFRAAPEVDNRENPPSPSTADSAWWRRRGTFYPGLSLSGTEFVPLRCTSMVSSFQIQFN